MSKEDYDRGYEDGKDCSLSEAFGHDVSAPFNDSSYNEGFDDGSSKSDSK